MQIPSEGLMDKRAALEGEHFTWEIIERDDIPDKM